MTIERLEELKNTLYEALHYQENCRDWNAEEQMEKDINKLIDDEINRLRGPCGWCEGNVSKYFDVNWYDFTEGNTRARPKAKFCPNCGQALDWRKE